jgi:hypothetical protein
LLPKICRLGNNTEARSTDVSMMSDQKSPTIKTE